jgi:nitrogen regulatory protein PII
LKQSDLGTSGVALLSMQVWLTVEGGNSLAHNKGAGLDEMKKIEVIIVPGKLDAVRAELERHGISATLTLTDVRRAEERKASLSPHTEVPGELSDRLKVELIVGDRQVQRAADVIRQYGQVALLRVNEALQIVPPLSYTLGNK